MGILFLISGYINSIYTFKELSDLALMFVFVMVFLIWDHRNIYEMKLSLSIMDKWNIYKEEKRLIPVNRELRTGFISKKPNILREIVHKIVLMLLIMLGPAFVVYILAICFL